MRKFIWRGGLLGFMEKSRDLAYGTNAPKAAISFDQPREGRRGCFLRLGRKSRNVKSSGHF